VWLAKVAERGMCAPSFVPPAPVRRLRNPTRYRAALTRERTREMQRVEKLLEDTQIKISAVVSQLFGASGRAMLDALVAGERDPAVLANLARGRLRPKKAVLEQALQGHFDDHHALLCRMMLDRVDRLTADIDTLTREITVMLAGIEAAARVDPGTGEIPTDPDPDPDGGGGAAGGSQAGEGRLSLAERLAEIPGISPTTAQTIIAEVGADTSRFPTPAHLASWAGLAPKARESAGRSKPGRTGKGNRHLAAALGMVVLSLSRTQTFYGARFRRIRASRGPQKAIVAVSRSVLTTVWHLLDDPDARYHDLGADYYDKRKDSQKQAAGHVRRLERLGFQVTLTPGRHRPPELATIQPHACTPPPGGPGPPG
jgi:transposase